MPISRGAHLLFRYCNAAPAGLASGPFCRPSAYIFYSLEVLRADGSGRYIAWCCYEGAEGPWSPDGRRVVVSSNGLFLLDPPPGEGSFFGAPTQIPNTSPSDFGPDWQPLVPGPQREHYKNASHYCKALQSFLGGAEFAREYKTHGKCVSQSG